MTVYVLQSAKVMAKAPCGIHLISKLISKINPLEKLTFSNIPLSSYSSK